MSALYYIDLSPEKCVSIASRYILLKHKDGSYHQGRSLNAIENKMTDEIEEARITLAQLRADLQVAQHRIAALEAAVNEARGILSGFVFVCEAMDTAPIASSVRLGTAYTQAKTWLENNAVPDDDDDDNQPALLTPSGYFTDWPEEDAPAPQAEQEQTAAIMFDE